MTSTDSQSSPGPFPPLPAPGPSAAELASLVHCHFILEGLGSAGICQEQGSQEWLCQAQMAFLLPFSCRLLCTPSAHRVAVNTSQFEDCCGFRINLHIQRAAGVRAGLSPVPWHSCPLSHRSGCLIAGVKPLPPGSVDTQGRISGPSLSGLGWKGH